MILCAALYLRNKTKPSPITDIILPCYRHGDGYTTLQLLNIDYQDYIIEEGFITTDNGEFVDRYQAFVKAGVWGQIPAALKQLKKEQMDYKLYSEDLY